MDRTKSRTTFFSTICSLWCTSQYRRKRTVTTFLTLIFEIKSHRNNPFEVVFHCKRTSVLFNPKYFFKETNPHFCDSLTRTLKWIVTIWFSFINCGICVFLCLFVYVSLLYLFCHFLLCVLFLWAANLWPLLLWETSVSGCQRPIRWHVASVSP